MRKGLYLVTFLTLIATLAFAQTRKISGIVQGDNGAVIAGGAGAIAVVQEVMPIIKEGGDMLSAMSGTAVVCLVIMVAAGAIWYFRKQRLDEEGA